MRDIGIGNYKSIPDFVNSKIDQFNNGGKSFSNLFELMFREKENVMYERSISYRIEYTTYAQAYKKVKEYSYALNELLSDIPKGSTVGLYMDNCVQWIEIFWAILASGYNPLLMNLRLSDSMLENAIKMSNAKAVISNGETFSVKTINESEIKLTKEEYICKDFGTEIMVMSSGTSNSIKVCSYTGEEFYYQICSSMQIINDSKEIRDFYNDKIKQLTFLPFYHIFGLTAMYIWFGFFSRTFVELKDMAPQTILSTIRRHKVTHIFAVPLLWETIYKQAIKTIKSKGDKTYQKFQNGFALMDKLESNRALYRKMGKILFKEVRDNLFGESVHFMITGGSYISNDCLRFFNHIGYYLINGYGMTEIGITSVELSRNPKYMNKGYIGRPISSIKYKINDESELLVKGNATSKYILEGNKKIENNDWYNTHDLAECHNGHYILLSRKDDIIITSNGENINPYMYEHHYEVAGVNEVCLIKSKGKNGIYPILLISVNKYISKETFNNLQKKINKTSKEIKLPNDVKVEYITDKLINYNEFKPNRKRLAEYYENNKLNFVNFSNSENQNSQGLMNDIKTIFANALNLEVSDINEDGNFFSDYGGNSLSYYSMMYEMSIETGVEFIFDEDSEYKTPKQIYDFVKGAKDNANKEL